MTDQITRLVFTNLLGAINGNLRFMLDSSVLLKEVSKNLEIIGWAIHRKCEISDVQLTSKTGILATAKLDISRPKVARHFKRFHNAESAGFRLVTANLPTGKFFLKVVLKNGKSVIVAEFKLVKYDQPKLLFMHIAKAAGSTVNSFFASHYPGNQYAVHIESNEKWRSSPDDLKKLRFISGHIHLHALKKKLDLKDYYKVTVVREPYSQLCSHLSWIRRLSDPGEEQRYKQHESYIQKFSSKLAKIDFANPEELSNLMHSLEDLEMRLVDNCQVRYFTSIPPPTAVGDADQLEAIRASEVFDQIGTTDHTGAFLKKMANKMLWPEPEDFKRENVTQEFYGLDTSRNDIRAALEPFVRHDLKLYEHVRVSFN